MAESGSEASKSSAAGIYDCLLGGTTNTQADKEAVEKLLKTLPEIADGAEANRGFLRRAVRYLAEIGIDQFADLGSGLPTQNNTDEVAQRVNPDARVVLVDIDPQVLQHVSRLEKPTIRAVQADIRQPREVLSNPAMEIIDFERPVALLVVAATHFITDEYDPWRIVREYLDALPSGSYLALSHLNGDGQPPQSISRIKEAWSGTETGIHFRSREQIGRFFDGLELVTPYPGSPAELVHLGEWGAEDPAEADSDGSRWAYCGVARKP
jgi:SAM-dependent methyltransferase